MFPQARKVSNSLPTTIKKVCGLKTHLQMTISFRHLPSLDRLYNMGTWGLTKAELERLDAYHRRHLRQIIGIHWPHRISNTALYRRCRCCPISENVKSPRWRLFGHVLRMPLDSSAQQAIDYYFADTRVGTFRGRPRTTLPTALSADLRRVGRTLR